jgi:hypothetical protein
VAALKQLIYLILGEGWGQLRMPVLPADKLGQENGEGTHADSLMAAASGVGTTRSPVTAI